MCLLDFKAISASIMRFRESVPDKNIFKETSSCQTLENLK